MLESLESDIAEDQVELFPKDDQNFDRLRLHYFSSDMEESDNSDVKSEEQASPPLHYPVPKAYELPIGEAIDSVGLYLKEMSLL